MRDRKLLVSLVGVVLVLWASAPLLVAHLYNAMHERGQFGDLFGSINSLFSGLAFAGLFYTIYLQSRQLQVAQTELGLQRQELRLQREEMAASRDELARQVAAQQALYRATVAQIAVAAVNAQIEATKMESETVTPGGRQRYWEEIRTKAAALSALADRLEGAIGEG